MYAQSGLIPIQYKIHFIKKDNLGKEKDISRAINFFWPMRGGRCDPITIITKNRDP